MRGRDSATRGPTIARSTDGGIGIPSRSAASSVSSTVLPFSSACMSTDDCRVRRRLTTKAGASLTRTPRLRELLRHVPGGRERRVVGRVGPDELDEREHGDGVEEVHADDAFRMREPGRHRADGQRGGVRDEQALGRDDLLERGEDLLLDSDLLEDRLDHEIAAAELGGALDARHDRGEEARLPLREPARARPAARDRRGSSPPPPPRAPARRR